VRRARARASAEGAGAGRGGAGEWAGAGWPARAGPVGLAALFFSEIGNTFLENKKIIRKTQIRYRWIRYEKYFNMKPNLKQKYKLYKIKI
jgi:hypothetical protein